MMLEKHDQNMSPYRKTTSRGGRNDYLNLDKGVDRKHRLADQVLWRDSSSIADNKTAEGRQKNRRVEMKIVFE